MKESLTMKKHISATPDQIFNAWLDSDMHSEMTGGEAECSSEVGGTFTAWDGYISGTNMELIENKKIVQSWRTTEFDESDEDSLLTIELTESETGTELILTHTNIPEGQTQYEQGWIEYYFEPMKLYFQ